MPIEEIIHHALLGTTNRDNFTNNLFLNPTISISSAFATTLLQDQAVQHDKLHDATVPTSCTKNFSLRSFEKCTLCGSGEAILSGFHTQQRCTTYLGGVLAHSLIQERSQLNCLFFPPKLHRCFSQVRQCHMYHNNIRLILEQLTS